MKKNVFFWNELKGTFWFIPSMILVTSVVLAFVLIYVDQKVMIVEKGVLQLVFVNDIASARTILSTIAGAMISVAGTVFSVTLVALTLASNQLGPRLIQTFMYVRLNQVVLGLYVSTFLYSLLVLNSIEQTQDGSFVPSISILVAIAFTVVNILMLIVFIHRIATSIQADKVIADVSTALSNQVRKLFPNSDEAEPSSNESYDLDVMKSHYKYKTSLLAAKSGYLQYVEYDSLLCELEADDELMELHYRPGGYVIEGVELATLYSDKQVSKDEIGVLLQKFVVGAVKNAQQDLEFSIHQIVEIALRALSSGVNDPNTAITCINNLTASMCYLSSAEFPSAYMKDEKEKVRIVADTLDFEGILDASFNQIRQCSSHNAAVIIRLMEVLCIIYEFCSSKHHRQAVKKHVDMTLRLGKETLSEKNDLQDLHARAKCFDI
ncbi:DUF2254 domain-containing protein [Bermanella marisrubri]|uniref:DUF2254 domain-containing protein n=1 Tax=Bermanella marisrubri TaxID=207949 RepID=Q1N320_9GAMM|nr:DUF2254 domain-containing protein [Bermanella marisrubri]EAT12499.1 hypothetical protein RED65_06378 [Oceanobacter sp. RED65] [Bermanella marisrubri]QIZ84939.1 DUF2254 domain-containing protein [Bermanella marisrubri]